MNGMRVRYAIQNMQLKVSNVNHPEGQPSYVLLTAYDDSNNEIVIELSHEQAEFLEDKFHAANLRWEKTAFESPGNVDIDHHDKVHPFSYPLV